MANLEMAIDGDGHIFEDFEAMKRHYRYPISESNIARLFGVFPQLDHLHHGLMFNPPDAFGITNGVFKDPGIEGWLEFMAKAGLEAAVVYPTGALGYGRLVDVDFAIMACAAYNDWLAEAYVQKDSRFKGMALIPMQEPQAAVEEMRRAITQLGMSGIMLPSTGLRTHLGAKEYWPVYEEAARLGCALGVHGGAHHDLGMNTLNVFPAIHAIGHPMGIMISMASLVFNGVFDKFPGLKVGFLEGGAAWFLLALERFSGSYSGFTPFDPRGELIQLQNGETVGDYLTRFAQAGQIRVGVEGDEPALPFAVKTVGAEAWIFSSDFPHEVNLESVRGEIEELLEMEELTSDEKEAILHRNAQDFYSVTPA